MIETIRAFPGPKLVHSLCDYFAFNEKIAGEMILHDRIALATEKIREKFTHHADKYKQRPPF